MRKVSIVSLGAALVFSAISTAALADPVVYTGGAKGDYYRIFGPALANVASTAAWLDYTVAETKGTPDNLVKLNDNTEGVALLQGNVWAALADRPEFANVQAVRADVANEVVLAIMSEKLYERSKGSWDAIVAKATSARIRFVTGPEDSGPGQTFKQFQALDPRLASASVAYADSVDKALESVVNGEADVALVVQFPNPENPRFEYIKTNHLKIAGVLFKQMRGLKVPGLQDVAAFEMCRGVTVSFTGGLLGFGQKANSVDTACTPLVYGVNKGANEDLVEGVRTAVKDQLVPKKGTGLGDVLAKITVAASDAASVALDAASKAGDAIAEQLK